MSSSSFFDLCPDILLDLFQYFSLNELFEIFIDLIPYLSSLLNHNYIRLHIDKNAKEDFWNEILPRMNSNQILSLHSSHFITNLSQFSSLRSINLTLQSLSLFDQFHSLIHLEQLSIQLSETIIENHTWLFNILILPKLRKLKLDLTISKNVLTPQKLISINQSSPQSNTIKHLELKIPMTWQSLVFFLSHFPNLRILRALLYPLNGPFISAVNLPCFKSLQTLDLQGYFENMSSIINYISSSITNLKKCRLIAMNVTNDDAFRMKYDLIWKHLFDSCSYLQQMKVHLIMSIEIDNNFNTRILKDLMWSFNNNSFCEKYNFRMEQLSINRGYVTLTGDYDIKTKTILT